MTPTEPASYPVTGLAGRYGHPLHPALVAVPIGAWVSSAAFDVASHLVTDPAFLAQGSRWLIGIGVLGAVVAALIGVLDLLAVPARTHAFRTALVHAALALTATVAYAAGFVARGGDPAAPVPAGPLALSAVGLAAIAAAGFLGGTLAYTYGVRVADHATRARGFHSTPHSQPKENP